MILAITGVLDTLDMVIDDALADLGNDRDDTNIFSDDELPLSQMPRRNPYNTDEAGDDSQGNTDEAADESPGNTEEETNEEMR